ncbi:MAG: alpha/beta fold hydrolase [Kordiimonadaceae bacterium]|nr:alpha/beta fold hydrolase [Kordiimonadaceae bacterium]
MKQFFILTFIIFAAGFAPDIAVPTVLAVEAEIPKDVSQKSGFYREEECTVRGVWRPVRCYSLRRPKTFGSAETIWLKGVILPSDAAVPEGDPLFILAGGPGQAASDMAPMMRSIFRSVLRSRDLVFFDIRGTGLSGPVTCATEDEEDYPPLTQIDMEEMKSQVGRCYRDHGPELAGATTKMAAEDIEALRIALGAEKINLWGGSYGTRLAQYYIYAHEKHVRSAILDGVVPFAPSYINETPSNALIALDKMTKDCAENSACAAAFPAFDPLALLEELEDTRVIKYAHPVTGRQVTTTTDRTSVSQVVFSALYNTGTRAFIPYALTQAISHNNWAPLAVLGDDVGQYLGIQTIYIGGRLGIICSEEQATLQRAEMAGNAFQNATALQDIFKSMCEAWPMVDEPLPVPDAGAFAVPVLFISGALDPITPPSLADHSLKYFSNAFHVIQKNGGHININVPCINDYATDFIADPEAEQVGPSCIGDGFMPNFIVGPLGSVPEGVLQ